MINEKTISRRVHDKLLDTNPNLLKHLFATYKSKWSLVGVTFFNVKLADSNSITHSLS